MLSLESFAPFLAVSFSILAFFIGYGIVVSRAVNPWLPLIGDCGTASPESHIFGILLNVSGFFFFLTIFFLYKNVDDHFAIFEMRTKTRRVYNAIILLLGWAFSIGILIIANFQKTVVPTMHEIGMLLFVFGSLLYFFAYIIMSYAVRPRFVSICMTNFRLVLHILIAVLLAFYMVCRYAKPFVKNGIKGKENINSNGIENYQKGDPKYDNHLATAISEWILVLLLLVQTLTLILDLTVDSESIETKSLSHTPGSVAEVGNRNATITTAYANHVFREENDFRVTPNHALDTYQTDTYMRRLPRINMKEAFESKNGTELMNYSPNYNPHSARSHGSEYY